jgi:putative ABC transport system ATP-binding protein
VICLKNITKSFNGPKGKITALNDVSLTLAPGEMLAINGPSGCGKSTLLLTAAGMLRPDQGEVELMEKHHPYSLPPEQRSRLRAGLIGFVFQQFHLIPYLSVKENIQAPALAAPVDGAEARAEELIQQFGLQDRADHTPSQLSTGERQRTALARALFNQPKIILADEPTGNLDDENAEAVLQCLRSYASAGGSVLLVTHNSKAADYATRTITMKAGRLQ